jgi:hypothetical protein
LDSLPPPPPAITAAAPSDIHPRSAREKELCSRASHPDWLYLGGLAVVTTAGIAYGSYEPAADSTHLAVRLVSPTVVGLTWGTTVGGVWLAMPQCDDNWVASAPREGNVRSQWPLALSLALLAGATAPIINGIIVGSNFTTSCPPGVDCPQSWTTFEREMHLVAAGVAGFAGAFLPYLVPPRSWAAARELDHIRLGADARGVSLGYSVTF